jgi:hypothetical protein
MPVRYTTTKIRKIIIHSIDSYENNKLKLSKYISDIINLPYDDHLAGILIDVIKTSYPQYLQLLETIILLK